MPSRKVAIVADPYTAQLYRLVGAKAFEASTRHEAVEALRKVATDAEIGLVLVAAEIYDQVEDEVERLRKTRRDIIVSRLPTLRSPGKPMDVQRELLRALGMG
jgi:V/A-type H+-transporting ATPase subunit F